MTATANRMIDLFGMGIVGIFSIVLILIGILWTYAKVIEPLIESKRVRQEWVATLRLIAILIPCCIIAVALICLLGLGLEYALHSAGLRTLTENSR